MPAASLTKLEYFTLAAAARALNVTQVFIRRLIGEGRGPPVTRVTGGQLFSDDQLAEWARRCNAGEFSSGRSAG